MATLVVKYAKKWMVYEVDARVSDDGVGGEGGAELGVRTVPKQKAVSGPRPSGPRMGQQPSIKEVIASTGVPEPVTIQVNVVFFGPRQISEAYRQEELPMSDTDEWCRVLHEREGVQSLTLNGMTVWSSEKSVAENLADAIDALRD